MTGHSPFTFQLVRHVVTLVMFVYDVCASAVQPCVLMSRATPGAGSRHTLVEPAALQLGGTVLQQAQRPLPTGLMTRSPIMALPWAMQASLLEGTEAPDRAKLSWPRMAGMSW